MIIDLLTSIEYVHSDVVIIRDYLEYIIVVRNNDNHNCGSMYIDIIIVIFMDL